MLREFKPTPLAASDAELEIRQQLSRGDLAKALKTCGAAKLDISQFFDLWEPCAFKMVQGRKVGELLSFMYKRQMKSQYEVPTLLRLMFEQRDWSGFLKQADRFQVYAGLEAEIEAAIQELEKKGQAHAAATYRRTFAARATDAQGKG